SMQIYIHRRSTEVELVDAEPGTTVSALVSEYVGDQGDAWLEGADTPLDQASTLEESGVEERSHVHVSSCKRVAVRVRYSDSITRDFPPAATVQAVFEWATGPHGFKLTDTEKAKHALGICDTTTEADKADHVGSFANDDCSVCFDLAPKERFEGVR